MIVNRRDKWDGLDFTRLPMLIKTPLPFCFADGPIYAETGNSTVCVRGGGSDLEKRQCTVQPTLFVNGKARVKLLIIF